MDNYQNAQLLASSAGRDWIGLHAEMRAHPSGILRSRNSVDTELIFVVRAGADFGGRLRRHEAPAEADGGFWLAPAGFAANLAEFPGEIVQALHIYLPATVFTSSYWREEDATRAIACLDYGSVFRDPLLEEIAAAILLELENATPDGPPLLEALGTCVAARLIHSHTKSYASATRQKPVAARRKPAAGRACERRLSKVVDYIDTHLDDNLRIQDLAGIACLSRFHFARAFKRSVGKSPHQYINTKRMHLALSLLAEDTLCLAQVARACGFSTQPSFNKAFARATGQCPGQYRRTRFEGSGAERRCRNQKVITTAAMDNPFAAMDNSASAAAQYS